ncbi:protein TolQ [Fibrobacterales bacterium]|nr:protein TolQ [Fibrobacterales bacterium]
MKTTIEVIKLSLGDPVTIAVLCLLILFSFVSWGILITKFFSLRAKQSNNESFYKKFLRIKSFGEVEGMITNSQECPLVSIGRDVFEEAKNLSPFVDTATLEPRAEMLEDAMQRTIEGCRLEDDSKLSFLAMTSNVSPFFGLFGTVWGIMQSFYEIGMHGSADLSVVAPGIAVALVTTVAGLIAAIPASMGYNYFAAGNNQREIGYYNFASHLLSLFKRGDLQAIEKALSGEKQ